MWCVIRIQGHLSEQWTQWIGDLSIRNQPNGEAVLSGEVADQSALYGIVGRLRDMGISLLALECHRRECVQAKPRCEQENHRAEKKKDEIHPGKAQRKA